MVWKTRKGGIFYLEDMKRNYTMPVIDCVWDELVHRGLDSEFEQE